MTYGNGVFCRCLGQQRSGSLRFYCYVAGRNQLARSVGFPFLYRLYGVVFGNGLFVAVGENGFITSSSDGTNWTPRTSPFLQPSTALHFGKGCSSLLESQAPL
jgi:hypothetical protein